MKKTVLFGLVVLAASSLFAAGKKAVTVHVGCLTNTINIAVADKNGYFAEEFGKYGAKYSVDNFANGPAENTAMSSGDLDLGLMAGQPALTVASSSKNIIFVGQYGDSVGVNLLVARTDRNINSVKDLKGKTVAVAVGTENHYHLDKNTAVEGISSNDYELINAKNPALLLKSGDVDAGQAQITVLKPLIDDGTVKVISDGSKAGVKLTGIITARKDFADKNPDLVVAYLKAIQRAHEYMKAHPKEAYELAANYLQVKYNILEVQDSLWTHYIEIKDSSKKVLEDELVYLKEKGTVKNPNVKFQDLYTDEYWKKAASK